MSQTRGLRRGRPEDAAADGFGHCDHGVHEHVGRDPIGMNGDGRFSERPGDPPDGIVSPSILVAPVAGAPAQPRSE